MRSLDAVRRYREGEYGVLKEEKWLMYIALTGEKNINLERIGSMEELNRNVVLDYVEGTLQVLEELMLPQEQEAVLEEVLAWSETAKCGMSHQRQAWLARGYNLFVHNLGSAEIYRHDKGLRGPVDKDLVYTLIKTHGLVGQYVRGEVALEESRPLTRLMEAGGMEKDALETLLMALNRCIIQALSRDLWDKVEDEVRRAVELIMDDRYEEAYPLEERVKRLRENSIRNGEDFVKEYKLYFGMPEIEAVFKSLFNQSDLWYVEAALYDFSFEEFVKMFLMVAAGTKGGAIKHISFEPLMKQLYYQHEGKKIINIYKKRVIEKYLSSLTIQDILDGRFSTSPHLQHAVVKQQGLEDTLFFNFQFSPAGGRLIEFCMEAEKSDVLYEKAIVLLFDLFGWRRDAYDRFYEEERYLRTMNQAIDYKRIILDYIQGSRVMDIGPGGGVLLDLIEDSFPDKTAWGVDISQNVIDALQKKKQVENRKWDIVYGDALNLSDYVEEGNVDTIIFCSILHELYSYIEFNGRRFNRETLGAALKSAYRVLSPGGRIIIRDGIMTEPVDQKRIIRFLSEDGMAFLERYASDFKGREIQYSVSGHNEVTMPVNDAMEFLYTYTWGEKSYVHEVNEQFGYFTPSEYGRFIRETLGEGAEIIENRHFLQEGYTLALSQKVEICDEARRLVPLPDSTCLIVIEKKDK